ncbi:MULTISPECIES: acyl-CoA synthetase [Mycobacteriaceae]|uniref:Acyl-CoA synthetase n=1 Tax=Mycolicibacterium mucogenicum DSM 44124 TaxID=1226753 RepID=A0A8H2JBH8_MYCMU|nr:MULTISPECIES: acyl-CoA synthetase [Mycobacteriaceae]KAB7758008.1 AMP-binding protein [Mycolicibacterium mucogenicum DSM 44124]QPG71439.1 acyl-CoA synthetase [Mycolicibacterium mucogenicum DSM 44124]SDZ95493.1 fatty-acyl-CoA synthase [Mycobacterium sp. 283mftsu]
MSANLLWPRYSSPTDLADIEAVPLSERGLPASTYALLARAAQMWPDRIAISVLPDGERWEKPVERTFGQLLHDVHQSANLLRDLGVQRHDAVALIAPNCDDLITATLAAQLTGIAAPINGALSPEHVSELVRRSGARVLITADAQLDASASAVADRLVGAGLIDTILLIGPTGATPIDVPTVAGANVDYLTRLSAAHDGTRFHGAAMESTDLAALFHTGGTTGAPKLAAHTHANEVADAWMIAANTLLDETSVLFAALPLFHVNALVVTLLAPLLRGQQVLWAGPLGYRDMGLYGNFWKIVERYRISTMSAVPTVYSVLSQIPVDADISSMEMAIVGASALPDAVRHDFQSHTGVPLLEGYGLTEATCASARSFPGHPRPGSVGQRLPYQQVKTVDIDDHGVWHELPSGQIGTLAIGGPTVFAGYVTGRNTDGFVLDGNGKLVDGWLDTGDLAWVDDDGFVHLCGRAKDLIIRGGHNIDPAMIEDALLAHPDVTGVAAVGRPDVHAGEVPVAYVTLRPDAATTPDLLRQWAVEHVAESAAAPRSVIAIDAIPVTAVGKPYKLPLRADATRNAVRDALAAVPGVADVEAAVDDGAIAVTVVVGADADTDAIAATLGRYALAWDIKERP